MHRAFSVGGSRLPAALVALLIGAATLGAQGRSMVGEDIYVGADETLDEAVCVGCSIRIDGRVGDAVAIGGSIRLSGEADDVVAIGGGASIDGRVHGDVVSIMGSVELGPQANVSGDIAAVLSGLERSPEAVVGGAVHESGGLRPLAISGLVLFLLVALVFALAVWPVVTLIAYLVLGERRVRVLSETVSQRSGMSFLLGIGVWVALLILSSLLPTGLFGVPGSETVGTLAFFVIAATGYAGISLWVGRGLLRTVSPLTATLVGALLITIIQLIPLVGWLLWIIFGWMALGAAVLSGFGASVDWMLRRTEIEPAVGPAR